MADKIDNSLKKILIDNKNLIEVKDYTGLYDKTPDYLHGPLTDILMRAGINPLLYMTRIPNYFLNHDFKGEFIIPETITRIGYSAFENCSGLTSVIIPNSVESIEDSVFAHCYDLTSITIPNSVTNIEMYAFYGCHADILYDGTEDDWDAISDNSLWGFEGSIHFLR